MEAWENGSIGRILVVISPLVIQTGADARRLDGPQRSVPLSKAPTQECRFRSQSRYEWKGPGSARAQPYDEFQERLLIHCKLVNLPYCTVSVSAMKNGKGRLTILHEVQQPSVPFHCRDIISGS